MISKAKMKIVIDNYFKSECNVDTSIRQAFEKGFRIGVQKGIVLQPEQKKGKWIFDGDCFFCSECESAFNWWARSQCSNFCPNCGADMMSERRI